MKNLWNAEPTMVLAVVSAGLAMGMGFGLPVTPQQMGLVMAFAAAVLGLINRSQVTSPDTLQNLTPATLATAQDAAQPVKDAIRKLPVVLLACMLAASSACATLHRTDGSLNTSVILADARWGVMQACDEEWLSAEQCVFASNLLSLADSIAAPNLKGSEVAVRGLIVQWEATLPPESRLRPYLDAVVALLPS